MGDYEQNEIAVERIRTALQQNRVEDAIDTLKGHHPVDQVDIFNQLKDDEQDALLPLLDIASTADLLEEMDEEDAIDAIESFSSDRLADVLDEMAPDEAADLIGDLPPKQASEVLAAMEDAREVIPLLGYPDESAGGLMTTSYIALRPQTTVENAIRFLRQLSPDVEVPYYLYVVDQYRRLVGIVGLRALVTASPGTYIEKIMDSEVISVQTGLDQEEVAELITRYDLAALPVLDDQGVLLGVITRDDISDVIEDETTEDIFHLGAVESTSLIDRPYWSRRIPQVVRNRFAWLLTLFLAGTLTGSVLRFFEGELRMMVSLSVFIPLLIGTGGNVGSQTVAMVIRALALDEIRSEDVLRVLWREVRTGILLGFLVGIVAFGWSRVLWGESISLSITVGLSVIVICAWSTMVAALVPLMASKVGIDPTIVSGPLMSTVIDATGLVIYFSLAGLLLPQL